MSEAGEPREAAPAGWYADPGGSTQDRYWSGSEWTHDLRDPPVDETGAPFISAKVKEKHAAYYIAALRQNLYRRETPVALYAAATLRPPLIGALAVTNARLIGLSADRKGRGELIAIEVFGSEIRAFTLSRRLGGTPKLAVTTTTGNEISFGTITSSELDRLAAHIEELQEKEPLPDAARALARRQVEDASFPEPIAGNVSKAGLEEIRKACRPGEVPRFILGGAHGAGALAAFDDYCMIVKKGAWTAMAASATGGGRVATFMYSEITGIEYNSGWSTGVLEILTASYQGTDNKDFWRGSTAGFNNNRGNPWQISNTLPLPKQAYEAARGKIDELRQLIAAAKRPVVHIHTDSTGEPPSDFAAELEKLADLHSRGLLDADEFNAAKAALIQRNST